METMHSRAGHLACLRSVDGRGSHSSIHPTVHLRDVSPVWVDFCRFRVLKNINSWLYTLQSFFSGKVGKSGFNDQTINRLERRVLTPMDPLLLLVLFLFTASGFTDTDPKLFFTSIFVLPGMAGSWLHAMVINGHFQYFMFKHRTDTKKGQHGKRGWLRPPSSWALARLRFGGSYGSGSLEWFVFLTIEHGNGCGSRVCGH